MYLGIREQPIAAGVPSLVVTDGLQPESDLLCGFAAERGWHVVGLDHRDPDWGRLPADGPMTYYGDTRSGRALVRSGAAILVEPAFDLLLALPKYALRREIAYGPLAGLTARYGSGFLKPADPCAKSFEAAVYRAEQNPLSGVDALAAEPALWSEPVTWRVEFRAVVGLGQILSLACYMRNGVRSANPLAQCLHSPDEANAARAFCKRLLADPGVEFPAAYVLDVGSIEGRGWAVVEFNPIWCSRFYGAVSPSYLEALRVATARVHS